MRTRNVILSVVLLLVLAAGGGAWWLMQSLDGLVKRAIHKWGPEITGVSVRVDSVTIELAAGKGTIRGLAIGNPKGYAAPHALKVGELSLKLDPGSVTKDVIVVKELLIASPDVVYERGPGGDNMSVIQKNVEAWVAKNTGPKQADAGPGKKFVIENLYLRNGRAHFGTTLSAAVPDMHLRDIGKKSNGATAGDVVKQVWGALARGVTSVATSALGAIKDGAKSAGDAVKKLFK
ncbi:MAG: hypothetical protein IT513_15430 [Burkholderiales bacterium]|nr:hypothetical protein [Burkholderiales bacterium]